MRRGGCFGALPVFTERSEEREGGSKGEEAEDEV
jgi:hypothetical protein